MYSVNVDLTKLFYNAIEKLRREACVYLYILGEEFQHLIFIFLSKSQYVMTKMEQLRNSNTKIPF